VGAARSSVGPSRYARHATGATNGSCELCTGGSVDHDQRPATPCECQPGSTRQNATAAAAAAAIISCQACLPGTFDHDLSDGTPCRSCPPGRFAWEPGTTSTCEACPAHADTGGAYASTSKANCSCKEGYALKPFDSAICTHCPEHDAPGQSVDCRMCWLLWRCMRLPHLVAP
jgi:hypothetical protein